MDARIGNANYKGVTRGLLLLSFNLNRKNKKKKKVSSKTKGCARKTNEC